MLRVEVTIEPFVEGQPGTHVTAALDAVRARGCSVDVGPFGSSFDVDAAEIGSVVGALLAVAYANGATHVQLDVADHGEAASA